MTLAGNTSPVVMDFPSNRIRPAAAAEDPARRALSDLAARLGRANVMQGQMERLAGVPEIEELLRARGAGPAVSGGEADLTETEAIALLNLVAADMRGAARRAFSDTDVAGASELLALSESFVEAVSELVAAFREGSSEGAIGSLQFDIEEYAETAMHYQGKRPGFKARLGNAGALLARLRDLVAAA